MIERGTNSHLIPNSMHFRFWHVSHHWMHFGIFKNMYCLHLKCFKIVSLFWKMAEWRKENPGDTIFKISKYSFLVCDLISTTSQTLTFMIKKIMSKIYCQWIGSFLWRNFILLLQPCVWYFILFFGQNQCREISMFLFHWIIGAGIVLNVKIQFQVHLTSTFSFSLLVLNCSY